MATSTIVFVSLHVGLLVAGLKMHSLRGRTNEVAAKHKSGQRASREEAALLRTFLALGYTCLGFIGAIAVMLVAG